MYPLGNLRIVSDLDNNYIAVLSKDQNEVISNKTAYVLLRKLPALLFGFFKKRRRFFFGVTSYRFFVLKSEYLICYDKQVSEKLQSHHVKDIREYVELANREEIKRVISLGHCTIEKRLVQNSSFVAEIIIRPDSGKAIHMMMNTMEDADIWYSMLLGSRVCVHIDDFEIIGELGQGAFGKVELVRYNKDHVLYALKTVELDNEGSSLLKQFVEERTIMQKLQNCPFIVQLRMAFREDHDLHYVLEYCDCGDLLSYIKAHGPLQEDKIRVIGGCIVSAIGFMHSHHFLHRDIKPENILLTENGIAKVADFGLSKTLSSMKSRAFSFCGTDLYRPPEMSQQAAGYNRALDWWQVGCVLYEMAIGVPPFDGTKEERRRKVLKEEPFYPSTLSTELISLLKGLLRKNAYERLGGGDGDADDIKNTQFFCKMNWTELEEKALCSKGSALGTPSPLRPDNKKQKKNHKKVIDDNDLLGFEYDEKVLSDLTSQLQSYIEMNSNISTCIGLNTISSYGSFVCYIMGNSQAKYNIQPKELKELQETTKFTADEIYSLYETFRQMSSSRIDDGVIDEQEFRMLVGLKEGFFFERIFSMFDKNNDGQIVFTEFVKCLAFLTSRIPMEDRLQFLFKFYDLKQDNQISRDELKRITEAMLFQYESTLPESILNEIVDETFQTLHLTPDDTIDFSTFCKIPHIGDAFIVTPCVK